MTGMAALSYRNQHSGYSRELVGLKCNSRRMAWRLENVDIDAPPVCSPVELQWKATVACGGAWDLFEVLGCTFLTVRLETYCTPVAYPFSMGICFCPPACSRRRIPTRMRLFSCILDLQYAMVESPKDKGQCSHAIHLKGIFATAFHELHLCRRSHFACSAAKPPFLCILLAYGVGTLSQPVFRIHLDAEGQN
jgi:hypothetical protein